MPIKTLRSGKIKRLQRESADLREQFEEGLRRHGITRTQFERLRNWLEDAEFINSDILDVQKRMETWGDDWSKDDHPHAIHARAPAVGAHSSFGN